MLRAARFIIIAVILLGLAWWVGTIPGTFTARSGALTVQTSVPIAIFLLCLVAIILTALLRIAGSLRRAPGGWGSWRGGRRQKLGTIATERGIVALAAGDAKAAASEAGRARKLLGETPLVLLLTAESARLAGRPEDAKSAFEKLTTHKSMAFLGHRGLLRHHAAAGDHDTAGTHAKNAEDSYPGSAWLKTQRLDLAVKQRAWRQALGLARTPAEIAAFATAAAADAPTNAEALGYAKQAVKAAPGLTPAVVAYATALRKAGKPRAARSALAKAWSNTPHPLIAAAYLEPITPPIERAQAAAELARAKPGHPETELLLAQTSLAAKLTGEARRHADAALALGLADKRVYAILAELDPGRDALALMSHAPSPQWSCTACHTNHQDWQPACPRCGKPATLAWTTATTQTLIPITPAA